MNNLPVVYVDKIDTANKNNEPCGSYTCPLCKKRRMVPATALTYHTEGIPVRCEGDIHVVPQIKQGFGNAFDMSDASFIVKLEKPLDKLARRLK